MTDTRGRQSRQDEVRTERRRRDDSTIDGGQAKKLGIPPEVQADLTAQGRTGRWVNDVGSRISDLTERDDWDRVPGVPPRTVVIDKKNGTTAQAIFVSKPNAFIAEDRAKKDRTRRDTEAAMLQGHVPGATATPDGMYADKANKIDRGNQLIE